ncbi:MAG: hypothetical protein IV105_21555 [Rhizobacter sp.]|nr:hypothetical protein [Rhizobacter sp.]
MSDDDFFALPAFKPDEALVTLKRQLRDLKPLAERGTGFEIGGKRVIDLATDATTLTARLAKRPATSPEWQTLLLKNSADVRKCVDEVKKRLSRWEQDAE